MGAQGFDIFIGMRFLQAFVAAESLIVSIDPALIHQFATATACADKVYAVFADDVFEGIPFAEFLHKELFKVSLIIHSQSSVVEFDATNLVDYDDITKLFRSY